MKVGPIVTKDCNNHGDRLDLVGGAYLQRANGFIAGAAEVQQKAEPRVSAPPAAINERGPVV